MLYCKIFLLIFGKEKKKKKNLLPSFFLHRGGFVRRVPSSQAESEAKSAALSEVEGLRRRLAEAERRAAPATVTSEAQASALALYRDKLGPAPDDPQHPSQLVASDAVESRLAAASANSDLMVRSHRNRRCASRTRNEPTHSPWVSHALYSLHPLRPLYPLQPLYLLYLLHQLSPLLPALTPPHPRNPSPRGAGRDEGGQPCRRVLVLCHFRHRRRLVRTTSRTLTR